MYNIYKGYIKDYDSLKQKTGITTYSIEMSSNDGSSIKNKNYYNIAHGFNSDPENTDTLYKKGTFVAFAVDDRSGDGFILAALDKNPGRNIKLLKEEEDISKTFENAGSPPITGGDWLVKKLDGFIAILYSGLIRLRAKLGTEIVLNPVLEMASISCRRFRLDLGQHGIVEFGFSEEEGKANFNMALVSDTTGEDPESTIVHLKAGQHEDNTKLSMNVIKNQNLPDPEILQFDLDFDGNINIASNKNKATFAIDSDGNISTKAKSFNFNINDETTVEIKEDGKTYIKTEEYYLGKGTTDQPLVRGKALQVNYDDLMDLVAEHEHYVINGKALRSFDLVSLPAKKLQDGIELSSTKKLD